MQYHRKYEHDVAEDLHGKPQKRSGAGDEKGDVIQKYLLVECKTAPVKTNLSYSVQRKDWDKISHHARMEGLIPAMAVGFSGLSLLQIEMQHMGGFLQELDDLRKSNQKYRTALSNVRKHNRALAEKLAAAEVTASASKSELVRLEKENRKLALKLKRVTQS